MYFKLDYLRYSRCFGKSLVQKNSICKLHALQPGELLSRWDDQMLKWFLLDSFKENNCFLPEGNSQPPWKSFSYQLVSPFFHFSRCGNSMFAILKSFTCSFHGSFVHWKLPLHEKSAVHKNFCCWSYFRWKDLQEFIFFWGAIGNKFFTKYENCVL